MKPLLFIGPKGKQIPLDLLEWPTYGETSCNGGYHIDPIHFPKNQHNMWHKFPKINLKQVSWFKSPWMGHPNEQFFYLQGIDDDLTKLKMGCSKWR